jgi:rhomboid protease GluP
MLTAAFLHADIVHIAMNGIALYFGGVVLETLVGRSWFFALFVIGGLGGSSLSMIMNPANMISVGASGAIMGIMSTAYVLSFRFPKGRAQMEIQRPLLGVLIPSLMPFASTHSGGRIDISAHLGGTVAGVLVGLMLLKIWPKSEPLPRFAGFAKAFSVVSAVVYLLAVSIPLRGYAHNRQVLGVLIPSDLIPANDEAAIANSSRLFANYPHDPRAHIYLAQAYLKVTDLQNAEKELRLAISDREIIKNYFDEGFEASVRVELAGIFVYEKRISEAKEILQPVCESAAVTMIPDEIKRLGICQ